MADIDRQREILKKLTAWRNETARARGVPEYMVLPNTTVNAIAQALPKDAGELYLVKGIKEGKMREYGKEILRVVHGEQESVSHKAEQSTLQDKPENLHTDQRGESTLPDALPVGAYLNLLNRLLGKTAEVRIIGEVGEIQERGNAIYFSLKDQGDGSVISIFMWLNAYRLSGVELVEGMEVIASGKSEIYKPTGRLSFRTETLELVGEGALKAAYEKLKKQLGQEGLFSLERKRAIPEYPERVGLITSKSGAVISDFLTNLGKHGYHIQFCDSRVEGASAVKDITSAIETLRKKDIDVLVIIRGGGGSFELLQTFNNEHVVRAIAAFPKPVICAIGHDKDVPLSQLAADLAPSTPSLCATAISKSWEDGVHFVRYFSKDIFSLCHEQLWVKSKELRALSDVLRVSVKRYIEIVEESSRVIADTLIRIRNILSAQNEEIRVLSLTLETSYVASLKLVREQLRNFTHLIQSNNPMRQLKLGYSILTKNGKLLRFAKDIAPEEHFAARLADGTIDATADSVHHA